MNLHFLMMINVQPYPVIPKDCFLLQDLNPVQYEYLILKIRPYLMNQNIMSNLYTNIYQL